MASITPQLESLQQAIEQTAPDSIIQLVNDAKEQLAVSFTQSTAIKVGDNLPSFRLQEAIGEEQTSTELLSQGPLIITFYRGEWCPFCNIALAGLQRYYDEFKAKGASLHDLKFPVLTDSHNEYARKLGIVWKQPESLRPVYETLGHDLQQRNGDESFEVPMPATLLVDKDGIVRNMYLNVDYFKRVEPKAVLGWIEAL